MRIYFLLIILGLFFFEEGFSQNQSRLSEQQLNDFQRNAEEKIHTLTSYIARIGDKKFGDLREKFIDLAISLFRNDAIIQVSSKNKSGLNEYRVRNYLNRLKSLQYDVVIIEYVAEAFYFSEFESVRNEDGSISYIATATIGQKFCGQYNSSKEIHRKDCAYSDYTEKQITIEIKRIKDYHGVHWVVLLGDITVSSTE